MININSSYKITKVLKLTNEYLLANVLTGMDTILCDYVIKIWFFDLDFDMLKVKVLDLRKEIKNYSYTVDIGIVNIEEFLERFYMGKTPKKYKELINMFDFSKENKELVYSLFKTNDDKVK